MPALEDLEPPYRTDMSASPIVVWRMRRVLTEQEFFGYLADVQAVLAKRQRFAQVVVSQLGEARSALTPNTRKMQADWVKKNFDELQRHCAAMAVVLTDMSAIAHFTVSTLMSVLGRAPSPYKILVTESEALEWARAQLRASEQRSSGARP